MKFVKLRLTQALSFGLKAVLYEVLNYSGQVRISINVAVAELLGRVEGYEADGRDAVGSAGVVEFNP